MFKFLVFSFVFLFVMTATANQVNAVTYLTPIAISPLISPFGIDINDTGQVVWSNNQIFLYDGDIAQPIVTDPFPKSNRYPKINSKGLVTWEGHDGNDREIYLYSNGVIKNISNNDGVDRLPKINAAGQVIWVHLHEDTNSFFYQLYLYSDGISRPIGTSRNFKNYEINDNGQVAWAGVPDGAGTSTDIFLYSNGKVQNISNLTGSEGGVTINNSGQVAWQHGGDIFMYSGGVVQNLTNSPEIYDNLPISMNDSGEVVWVGYNNINRPPGEDDLFLYSGGSIQSIGKVTYSGYNDYPFQSNLDINNSGQVVWWNFTPYCGQTRTCDDKLYLYSSGSIQVISDGINVVFSYPQINNRGQIVFLKKTLDSHLSKLYLANPSYLNTHPHPKILTIAPQLLLLKK